jgi:hypothetical protein
VWTTTNTYKSYGESFCRWDDIRMDLWEMNYVDGEIILLILCRAHWCPWGLWLFRVLSENYLHFVLDITTPFKNMYCHYRRIGCTLVSLAKANEWTGALSFNFRICTLEIRNWDHWSLKMKSVCSFDRSGNIQWRSVTLQETKVLRYNTVKTAHFAN